MMGLSGLYRVQPSPLDETKLQEELRTSNTNSTPSAATATPINPVAYTKRLAEAKAEALAKAELYHTEPNINLEGQQQTQQKQKQKEVVVVLYLGSDTIVEIDDEILEKPNSVEEARAMLSTMSGRQHHVHTGVALYGVVVVVDRKKKPTTVVSQDDGSGRIGSDTDTDTSSSSSTINNIPNNTKDDTNSSDGGGGRVVTTLLTSFVETATVEFAQLSLQDIDAYIETGEPMDKAGSYGIQGIGGQFVTNITGDFFTVMGLPMHRTSTMLASALSSSSSSSSAFESRPSP